MKAGLRGNPASLRQLAQRLKALPTVVAQDIAAAVAPKLTSLAQASYAGGTTVYGDARPAGKDGRALDLIMTGATQERVRFAAVGTVVRAVLPTRYAKFLIGKYRILPMGAMPTAWSDAIAAELPRAVNGRLGAT